MVDNQYKFCECGRVVPCKWHDGKEPPKKKGRGVKFSGDSRHQQENNGFNGKRGR